MNNIEWINDFYLTTSIPLVIKVTTGDGEIQSCDSSTYHNQLFNVDLLALGRICGSLCIVLFRL